MSLYFSNNLFFLTLFDNLCWWLCKSFFVFWNSIWLSHHLLMLNLGCWLSKYRGFSFILFILLLSLEFTIASWSLLVLDIFQSRSILTSKSCSFTSSSHNVCRRFWIVLVVFNFLRWLILIFNYWLFFWWILRAWRICIINTSSRSMTLINISFSFFTLFWRLLFLIILNELHIIRLFWIIPWFFKSINTLFGYILLGKLFLWGWNICRLIDRLRLFSSN